MVKLKARVRSRLSSDVWLWAKSRISGWIKGDIGVRV